MTRLAPLASILTLALLACAGGESARTPTASVQVDPIGQVDVPTSPHLRGWRRMDIGQLDASIRRVTGGIGWDNARGKSEFTELSATLGVPDYLDATTEDLSPSLLFQKFLDDASVQVCDALVAREVAATSGHVLLVGVTPQDTVASSRPAVEAALSHALRRFHGCTVAVGDPQLEPWVFLFESATLVTGSPEAAWRTVCVGLLTHPDFYTY